MGKGLRHVRIRLSDIVLEDSFRKTIDSIELTHSTSMRGLECYLIVEGPNQAGKYILVEGYRRYAALIQSGHSDAMCTVHKVTDPTERLLKRLRTDFHTQKRTSYERERMIEALLNLGVSEREIASKTDVSISTVRKYMKSVQVESTYKSRAEQNGAGKDGLTKLWGIKTMRSNVWRHFLERYVTRDRIRGTDVDSMVKVSNVKQFADLSEPGQISCLNESINKTGFDVRHAQEIVYNETIRLKYDPEAHQFIYSAMCAQLESIAEMQSIPHFIENLTTEQRFKLNRLGTSVVVPVTPPLNWREFPNNEEQPPQYN